MATSKIEWTEATWNPVTGCTKVSPGCTYCYAERLSLRLKSMGQPNYKNGFQISLHPHTIEYPLKWKKSKLIFVNSMSDLFHEDIPEEFIIKIFDVMKRAHWHTFQILTKRSLRLAEIAKRLFWPPNIWMGVSIENSDYKYRIEHLLQTPSKVKFLSLEPLLGPLGPTSFNGIDWVIVGGESGPNARKMEKEWVIDIHEQCKTQSIPFFFKQWGGKNKKKSGRLLEGRTWDSLPKQPFEDEKKSFLFPHL